MERRLYRNLLEWKKSARRKPLLLQGARQVGKTWLINDFGRREYQDYIYLNFEQNPGLRSLFTGELAPGRIIHNISLYLGRKIEAANTLICFDEIQTVPEAITSLKYFYEQAPEYHLIAAGSLLGVQVGKTGSFPVGKVNFMTLHPLSFAEYLEAVEENLLLDQLRNLPGIVPLPELIHEKLLSLLKMFLYTGGMPEVVQNYLDSRDIAEVRSIQEEILEAYRRDFSKYTDAFQTQKTSEVWQSIPFQLARENKKFKYSDVRSKARASTFEQTIEWLKNAGLIHLAFLLRTPKLPLAGYADYEKFKVYHVDTGLLGAMLGLSSDLIIQPNQLFAEYNGAFIENFVATELVKENEHELFYWTSQGNAEVDFIISHKNELYPVEVKSGTNRKTGSLRSYADKYHPRLLLRISPRNLIHDREFINVPLYMAFALPAILERVSGENPG
ncbi:MAG: ATP-binding protein [Saprospirales bacterium]|nr:ATP-binding protein [Saprospirales bacterium]